MLAQNPSSSIHKREPTPGIQPLRPVQGGGNPEPMRRRLAYWIAVGAVPPDVPPTSIAAAHARLTGRPPARDPERRANRAYSADELRMALAHLAERPPRPTPPPPPQLPLVLVDPLALIWWATLQRLLPSTRMLLGQQAQLVALAEIEERQLRALVEVPSQWLPMVDDRRGLVVAALADTLSRSVQLELRVVDR